MLANIKGLVDRLELSQAKAMMPLFEAISNAVDAIEDCKDGFFKHSIVIRLIAAHDLAHQGGDETVTFDGFEISDDGVGFNDFNLASFKKAHTLSKVQVGGKGVGRFTFLKVFSNVHVRAHDDVIVWVCPRCRTEGRIPNWQGSLWDLRDRPSAPG